MIDTFLSPVLGLVALSTGALPPPVTPADDRAGKIVNKIQKLVM
jgi:hypothetical protein